MKRAAVMLPSAVACHSPGRPSMGECSAILSKIGGRTLKVKGLRSLSARVMLSLSQAVLPSRGKRSKGLKVL